MFQQRAKTVEVRSAPAFISKLLKLEILLIIDVVHLLQLRMIFTSLLTGKVFAGPVLIVAAWLLDLFGRGLCLPVQIANDIGLADNSD